MDDDEVNNIDIATAFCRRYALRPPFRLLQSAYRVWQQTLTAANSSRVSGTLPLLADDLLGAFVGWLLIWRLIIDQADHGLSDRFGKLSEERAKFHQAKKDAYDNHQGYRLVEALRNLAQHREMPPLNMSHATESDQQTGSPATTLSLTFPVAWLLSSSKCPATIRNEFKSQPQAVIDLIKAVEDAMTGFEKVLRLLIQIDVPELNKHVTYLRGIFREAIPGIPVLLRISGEPSQAMQIEMRRLDDLLPLVRDAPFPSTTTTQAP